MPAIEFDAALQGARTMTRIEEINRAFLGTIAAGTLDGEEAERIDAAIAEARQRVRAITEARASRARRPPPPPRPLREKVFGNGRARPLDRNAKVRVMHHARALSRRTVRGKAYGVLTAKALTVLEALLWGFHNA